jgi:dTDP-4-amino-4,6-dideoxygalactose transaminase
MNNIPLFKVFMSDEAVLKSSEILKSGFIGQGKVVDEFEKELSSFLGSDQIITTNSATSAQHLALHLLKQNSDEYESLKPGDEILTTALTCTATNWPILANGFNIKWVDIDPNTLNMDLDDLARKITAKTKAIIVVHWGGYPINLDKLKRIQYQAQQLYGFKPIIIEDCAHAFGSERNGKKIGSESENLKVFSFQAIKHLTSGDGGALVIPSIMKNFYNRAKKLRWYGIDRESHRRDFRCEPDIAEWGFKFHMNDINAAIGLANLKCVKEEIIKIHKENAAYYDTALKDVGGITLLDRDYLSDSASWIYSMLVEDRDEFQKMMESKGIMTSQVHQRNDIHSCVKEYRSILPNLDKLENRIISIPVGWWVTEKDRKYIVETIKQGW